MISGIFSFAKSSWSPKIKLHIESLSRRSWKSSSRNYWKRTKLLVDLLGSFLIIICRVPLCLEESKFKLAIFLLTFFPGLHLWKISWTGHHPSAQEAESLWTAPSTQRCYAFSITSTRIRLWYSLPEDWEVLTDLGVSLTWKVWSPQTRILPKWMLFAEYFRSY